ncbi:MULTISPECIES: condensation domain-containing protein [Streptomyces]|uniref:Uncharacterized protein n=2 Tax=Streptomyces griseiscabiei TaxID=2993540 RepID=A0ABU4KZA2_9ACTN|nr:MULTISPECIES: hypothetical protein [Streptomyces]MBZ3908800.1 hypothetical protein [Streptomyces griseiscabiei]MDX2908726.1 hypothetical protein [Streptomyces griseiscabiei]
MIRPGTAPAPVFPPRSAPPVPARPPTLLTAPGTGPLQLVVHLAGWVDPVRMRTAVKALLDRGGHKPLWRELDLGVLNVGERTEALDTLLEADRRSCGAPGPAVRATLVRLAWERHLLVFTARHPHLDEDTLRSLLRDLLRSYAGAGTVRARGGGPPVEEAPVPLTTADAGRLTLRALGLGVDLETVVRGAWTVVLAGAAGRREVVLGTPGLGTPGPGPAGRVTVTGVRAVQHGQPPLTLVLRADPGPLELRVRGRRGLFGPEAARDTAERLAGVLRRVARDSGANSGTGSGASSGTGSGANSGADSGATVVGKSR